jgi:heat shock protein HslJ
LSYKDSYNLENIMKRAILFFSTLLISVLIVSSCCDCRKRSKLEKPLVGTEWQLVQLMGSEVKTEGDSYTIMFHDNGTATGAGDCNRMTATYSISAKRDMKILNLGATRRLCPNFEQENAYFDMLEKVTHYEMDADNMLLLSNGTLVGIMHAVAVE